MNWFSKFRRLKPPGRRMLATILFNLPLVHLSLQLYGLNRTQIILSRFSKRFPQQPPADTPKRLARARHLFRYTRLYGPFKGNCLSRTLLMKTILQKQGIASELTIGVRFDEQQFKAHAWLEIAGKPLNERQDVRQRFSVFQGSLLPKETPFV